MARFVVVIVRDNPHIATKVVNVDQIKEVSRQHIDSLKEDRYTVHIGDGKHGWCEYLLPASVNTDLKAIAYLSWAPQGEKR